MQLNQKMECQNCKKFVYPIIEYNNDIIRIYKPVEFELPNYRCPICNKISKFILY